jgi:hypothetical protein
MAHSTSLSTLDACRPGGAVVTDAAHEVSARDQETERHRLGPVRRYGWSVHFRGCECGHVMLASEPEMLPAVCTRDEPESFVPKR